MRTGWFYILAVTLLVWVPQSALAERHAIVVGVNQGPSPLVPLRYAHDDARKIEEILRELGGVPKSNMRLLLEPDLEELQSMLWTTTSAAKPGDELFFYYSGHADDQGLLLHNERFPQAELRALLDDNRFQVRVAVIDACKSGSFTREKVAVFGPSMTSIGHSIPRPKERSSSHQAALWKRRLSAMTSGALSSPIFGRVH